MFLAISFSQLSSSELCMHHLHIVCTVATLWWPLANVISPVSPPTKAIIGPQFRPDQNIAAFLAQVALLTCRQPALTVGSADSWYKHTMFSSAGSFIQSWSQAKYSCSSVGDMTRFASFSQSRKLSSLPSCTSGSRPTLSGTSVTSGCFGDESDIMGTRASWFTPDQLCVDMRSYHNEPKHSEAFLFFVGLTWLDSLWSNHIKPNKKRRVKDGRRWSKPIDISLKDGKKGNCLKLHCSLVSLAAVLLKQTMIFISPSFSIHGPQIAWFS